MSFNKFERTTVGATFAVVATDADGIISVNITDGGDNYMVGDVLPAIDGTTGTGLVITVTGVDGGYSPGMSGYGAITEFTFVDDGNWVEADSGSFTVANETLGLGEDFVDHTEYELGGDLDEYITGTGLLVDITTVDGDGAITAVSVGTNDKSKNFVVGTQVRAIQGDNDSALLEVLTVDAKGVVQTIDIIDGGEGYTTEDDLLASVASLKTDSPEVYWLGTFTGVWNPSHVGLTGITDNDPLIRVVRPADEPQLKVQKTYADNGKTTVWAEPTLVDSFGKVVGNTVRAEDMTDRPRCEANGFIWVVGSTGDADQGSYGYCREMTIDESVDFWNGNATSYDDCPAGTIFDGTDSCVALDSTAATGADLINAAALAGDIDEEKAMRDCEASGNFWDIYSGTCIAGDTPGNFDMDTFVFESVDPGRTGSSNGSKRDYLANACRNLGYIWNYKDNTCSDAPTQAVLDAITDQPSCLAAGYTWIAGTCYNPNDFGDGQNRAATAQQDPNAVPK